MLERWVPPPSIEKLWTGLIALIEQEQVKTSEFVMDELASGAPAIAKKLHPYQDLLVEHINVEIGLEAGRISEQFPKMCHPTGRSERADPWVIAIAKVHGAMVVSEEDGTKNPDCKIPNACKVLGIKAITLRELLDYEPSLFAETG